MTSSRFLRSCFALMSVAAAFVAGDLSAQPLRDFSEQAAWRVKAPGMEINRTTLATPHGPGLEFAYDFQLSGNFGLIHQDCDVPVEGNFELSFWMKADSPTNNIEIKLGDVTGNTYWYRRDSYAWPKDWTHVVLRKRQLVFAWGPKSAADLTQLKSIEFVVSSSGAGKQGTVTLAGLKITSLGAYGKFSDPIVARTASVPLAEGATWRTAQPVDTADFDLTLGQPVEFGGLEIEWEPGMAPAAYDVLTSTDGVTWKQVQTVGAPSGRVAVVRTPDAEGRQVRLHARAASAVLGIKRLKLLPPELGQGSAELLKSAARSSPVGFYPRHLLNQQAYWTLIGYSGGKDKALLCEDGQIELAKGLPSIDPFLIVDGQVQHWANTEASQGLADGYLPLPWMERAGPVSLRVSGFATKDDGGTVYACYTVANRDTKARQARLVLALRPVQVNPEWQHSGVVAPIADLSVTPTSLNFGPQRSVVLLAPADRVGATAFADGEIGRWLQNGDLPEAAHATDADGLASGFAAYDVELAPGEARHFWLRYNLAGQPGPGARTGAEATALQERVASEWRATLAPIQIQLPESEQRLVDLIRSNIAYIMINRDGVRLQPGSRNYHRSWIRDGALMSAAMMHFGVMEPAREYIDWYTQFVQPDGYVPAIIEHDQPLPTLECDSFGEYIYLVTDYWRFSHDEAFSRQYYPVVKRVAEYIEKLHREGQERYKDATGVEALFKGLLPPSISHEGYGSPVHSYWDNYFAILGLKDAALLAAAVGQPDEAAHFGEVARSLRRDVVTSLEATAKHYGIDEIASCPDYGEGDASGVAILFNPCGEMPYMPATLLKNTFDSYYGRARDRADGTITWSGYTPYEFRNIGVFARYGEKDRALWLMRWFAKDTRPMGWNHWAEVVFQDARAPVYIGDMPHTWCAAEFVREIRDYFVYEEEQDRSLVFCSGVPTEWLQGRGIQVQDLPTAYGRISLRAATQGATDAYEVTGQVNAPGAIWLVAARSAPPKSVTVNGVAVAPAARIKLLTLPAKVEFGY